MGTGYFSEIKFGVINVIPSKVPDTYSGDGWGITSSTVDVLVVKYLIQEWDAIPKLSYGDKPQVSTVTSLYCNTS